MIFDNGAYILFDMYCSHFIIPTYPISFPPLCFLFCVYHCLPYCTVHFGLSRWLSGKESSCQCRRCKRHEFKPWVRKTPWRSKWQPTPVFLPGKSHGQRSLVGYSLRSRKESDITEWPSTQIIVEPESPLSFFPRSQPFYPGEKRRYYLSYSI